MYVESCTILVVCGSLIETCRGTDRLLGLYGLKYDSATACGLPLYLYSYKLVGSATSSANTTTSAGDVVMEALGSEPPSAGLESGLEPPSTGLALGSEPRASGWRRGVLGSDLPGCGRMAHGDR